MASTFVSITTSAYTCVEFIKVNGGKIVAERCGSWIKEVLTLRLER